MRKPLLVTRELEYEMINKMIANLKILFSELNPKNTVVVMVSPDYSATVAMHVAHALSQDGEMCDLMMVDVPYPDQDKESFVKRLEKQLKEVYKYYQNYVLVEAGIIRGGNYTWICNTMREYLPTSVRIITAAMYENIHSSFQCDVIGSFYNNEIEDLTFYYEQYNKHWD